MKPLLFLLALSLAAPLSAKAAQAPAQVQTCISEAKAKVMRTSAYRNGSVREKQALLRRADLHAARVTCAQ